MALKRGDERELAFITFAPVGHDFHGPAVPLRDEAGKREDVDQLATPSLESSAELVVHKRLGPATIRLLVLPNHHGAQATPRLDRARFWSEPRNSVDQRHIRERVRISAKTRQRRTLSASMVAPPDWNSEPVL